MRQSVCQTMKDEQIQKDLAPVLYYDDHLLLSPEEWMELMQEESDDHRLACDLPFVQLTANLIKRNISLLIVKQKDVEKLSTKSKENEQSSDAEIMDEEEIDFEEKFFTVFGDGASEAEPLTMLYFPGGQFQVDAHFESLRSDKIDANILKKLNQMPNDITYGNQKLDEKDVNEEDDVEDYHLDDDFNVTEVNTKGNAFNQITLLTPQDPSSSVIVNDTKKVIRKKLRRGMSHTRTPNNPKQDG